MLHTKRGVQLQTTHQIDAPCSAALSELDQFDKMINWMLLTYFGCLALGWGLLLFDWVWNKVHKLHSQVQSQGVCLSLSEHVHHLSYL